MYSSLDDSRMTANVKNCSAPDLFRYFNVFHVRIGIAMDASRFNMFAPRIISLEITVSQSASRRVNSGVVVP
jgi:hypothetical protein